MLESFFSQQDLTRLAYEIIVVDNNSTDDTSKVVMEFLSKPGFCYISEFRQGLSFARNRGIAEATGDFVSFLDDDVIVDSRWLANLQKCLDETHADAVGGKVELNFQTPPPAWLGPLFRMHLAELDLAPTRLVGLDRSGYSGCNITFRKQTLRDMGGFNEKLGRTGAQLECLEETVVLYRIKLAGGKLVYDPAVRLEHLVGPERMTWSYFKRLSLGQGISLARLEIEGEVMSHIIALIFRLGLEPIFRNFLNRHNKSTKIVLVEQNASPSKWLKLILVDLSIFVASAFKLLLIYVLFGDSYNRKVGQASILTAASRALHRWKNLWDSIFLSSSVIKESEKEPPVS
jgi:glycosyltransferase involved in cell wall biosynthesis